MKNSLLALLMTHVACIPAHATEAMNNANEELKQPTSHEPGTTDVRKWEEIAKLLQEAEREEPKTPQDAIRKGDAKKLKAILLAKKELLTQDLLIRAARDNQTECLKVLLELGVSPDAPDDKSENALHTCAALGYAEGVKLLLHAGADMNMRSAAHGGSTPLMLAANNNQTECAKLLVEAGADGFIRTDTWSYTALHWALDSESPDVFKYLLSVEKIRADKALIQELFEPLPQNAEFVRILMNAGATTGNAWADAVCYGDEQKLQKLLESGAYKGADNMRQLLRAIRLHDATIMQYVLQTGVDVTHFARDAGWEVTSVLKQGKTEHLQMLIEHGMNVNENCSANMNHSLLIEAAFRGCDEAVDLLLKSGADINAQDSDGYTPLMYAYNSPAKVKLILARNPDLSLRNRHGVDAITLFRDNVYLGDSHAECYRLLQEYMQQKQPR
ncbi:MAG: ankyrin repeat domain-containing protein [Akkermansia sp.]|nr:ankyrin repeat domain-containing protein [Akkermansia sp.]